MQTSVNEISDYRDVFSYSRLPHPAKFLIAGVLVWALFIPMLLLAQDFKPKPGSPVAQGLHPRLLITAATRAEIVARIKSELGGDFQTWIDAVDANMGGNDWHQVVNCAFIHQTGLIDGYRYRYSLSQYTEKAKSGLLSLRNTNRINYDKFIESRDEGNYGLPIGYDWLYDVLSDSERRSVASRIAGMLRGTKITGPPLEHNDGVGVVPIFVNALAIYGDGYEDATAREYMNLIDERWEAPHGTLGMKEFMARDFGGTNSGWGYGSAFWPQLYVTALAFYTAAELDYFKNSAYFNHLIYNLLYQTLPLPYQGEYFLPLDAHDGATSGAVNYDPLAFGWGHAEKTDPNLVALRRWYVQQHDADFYRRYTSLRMYENYVWGTLASIPSKSIRALSPAELGLPLSKHFKGTGTVVMRQSFDNQNATYIRFKAMPWGGMGGYWSNQNQGNFIIHKYGPLVLEGGGGAHHDFSNVGWLSNLIYFQSSENDHGGQRDASKAYSLNDLVPGNDRDLGGVQRIRFEPNSFDYVKARLERAYDRSQVDLWSRELLYMRPARVDESDFIFVFDKTQVPASTRRQAYQLVFPFEPNINGSASREASWKTRYADADLIEMANTHGPAHGRIFIKRLLPAQASIYKVGGPGYEFVNPAGQTNDTIGRNNIDSFNGYKGYNSKSAPLTDADAYFSGRFKTWTVPSNPARETFFFHVFQTGDANTLRAMQPTSLIDLPNFYGCTVADIAAFFNKSEQDQTQVTLNLPAASVQRVVVAGLQAGTYRVSNNGQTVQDGVPVRPDDNTIYFQTGGRTGDFQIVQTSKDVGTPVELQHFGASVDGSSVVLAWATTNENNNVGFEIYRAQDGEKVKVGFVAAGSDRELAHEYTYRDTPPAAGVYRYTLRQIDANGQASEFGPVEVFVGVPVTLALAQNHPNPFNPETVIRYSLPKAAEVELAIYNTAGQRLVLLDAGFKAAGEQSVTWDGRNSSGQPAASGLYFYRLKAGDQVLVRKMLLAR